MRKKSRGNGAVVLYSSMSVMLKVNCSQLISLYLGVTLALRRFLVCACFEWLLRRLTGNL
jgi:hypothetical protein